MTDILGSDIVAINGQFVSQKVSQVVQAIKEYEPTIEVEYIPITARQEGQAAYRIVHYPLGAKPYVMFTVRRDEDMDFRVLQKIMANDNRYGTTPLSEYEAWEAAQAAVQRQKMLDRIEEANDIAYHALRSPLNTYRVDKDLVIKDGIPFNAAKTKGS